MMKLSRDSWLALGLILLLSLVTIAAAFQQTKARVAPPLASDSAQPDGALALKLWLDALDYEVAAELQTVFHIPDQAGLIFMLEPFSGIIDSEWQIIDHWVEQGGTLVVAGENFGTVQAMRHYQVDLSYFVAASPIQAGVTPLFTSPPPQHFSLDTRSYLIARRNDIVTHLTVEDKPVLLSFALGQGRVILSALPNLFSNRGLKVAGTPALTLNIISAGEAGKTVWFDEWHHGRRLHQVEVVGPWNWLRFTPAGQSLLLVAGLILVGVALRGRHFGRPLPVGQASARRGPLEYTGAIANLNRRAGHRRAVLQHYREQLKRGLGQRYRLNPTLPDHEYLAQLAKFKPDLDRAALASLLARLDQGQVSENEMVQLAAAVADWLKER